MSNTPGTSILRGKKLKEGDERKKGNGHIFWLHMKAVWIGRDISQVQFPRCCYLWFGSGKTLLCAITKADILPLQDDDIWGCDMH